MKTNLKHKINANGRELFYVNKYRGQLCGRDIKQK